MSEARLIVDRPKEQPGVVCLKIDNPDEMNAVTANIYRALAREFRKARINDDIKAVVLSGAGDRAFSGGLSMGELDNIKSDRDRMVFYTLGLEVREGIFALGKPIIAAVNGLCVGAGFEMSLCCDLVYASEGSKFLLPEVNIGLTPGCGGAINLAAKMPLNRAMEALLFSEKITAEELNQWGIVNKVFPKETFWQEVNAIVDRLIDRPILAVRGIKEIMSHSAVMPTQAEALKIERRLSADLMNSYDFKEAVSAFKEKRKPVFKGRG